MEKEEPRGERKEGKAGGKEVRNKKRKRAVGSAIRGGQPGSVTLKD